MKTICSVLLLSALAALVNSVDYCKIKTCPTKHVMCAYPEDGPSPKCQNIQIRGLTDSEKDIIVTRHNYLRSKVARGLETRGNPGPQPPAKNLGFLEWDEELEAIAQRWADQCVRGTSPCIDVERFMVGQNIMTTEIVKDPFNIIKNMVDGWYENVVKFNSSTVPSVSTYTGVGTYTQFVWAATTKIGCGRMEYEQENGRDRIILVCNYGPTGNIIGQPLYEIDTSKLP